MLFLGPGYIFFGCFGGIDGQPPAPHRQYKIFQMGWKKYQRRIVILIVTLCSFLFISEERFIDLVEPEISPSQRQDLSHKLGMKIDSGIQLTQTQQSTPAKRREESQSSTIKGKSTVMPSEKVILEDKRIESVLLFRNIKQLDSNSKSRKLLPHQLYNSNQRLNGTDVKVVNLDEKASQDSSVLTNARRKIELSANNWQIVTFMDDKRTDKNKNMSLKSSTSEVEKEKEELKKQKTPYLGSILNSALKNRWNKWTNNNIEIDSSPLEHKDVEEFVSDETEQDNDQDGKDKDDPSVSLYLRRDAVVEIKNERMRETDSAKK